MKYTDKEVGSYTVNGEERVAVERTFTDGTVHHLFYLEDECEHCENGTVDFVEPGPYSSTSEEPRCSTGKCPICDGTTKFTEEVPCDLTGNDEDSPFYLPYVNAKSEGITDDDWDRITFEADTAMPNRSGRHFPDPNDFAMDSFG